MHYYLVAGRIYANDSSVPDGQDGRVSLDLNCVVDSTKKQIDATLMGKAQQALQLRFFKEANDTKLEVFDVFLMNFVYCGLMSPEEFAKPSGAMQSGNPSIDNPFEKTN